MAIYELDGVAPRVAASAWVADTAQVIGNVVLGENASVWFGTVVRGDTESITIGAGSNIQDASVLHADFGVLGVVHVVEAVLLGRGERGLRVGVLLERRGRVAVQRGLDARVSGTDDGNIKFSGVVGLHAFLSAISFKMARMLAAVLIWSGCGRTAIRRSAAVCFRSTWQQAQHSTRNFFPKATRHAENS